MTGLWPILYPEKEFDTLHKHWGILYSGNQVYSPGKYLDLVKCFVWLTLSEAAMFVDPGRQNVDQKHNYCSYKTFKYGNF